MTQKVQIKRGSKKNLPKLNSGEPAFSINTKEFFIGNNDKNQKTQTRENLIINGNFQVVGESFDISSNKIIIPPGTSRYIYGNFYVSNSSNSLGNITISRPNSGFITIECTNAKMSFEYREKLAEYVINPTKIYANIQTLLNQDVTLSFDYKNAENTLNFLSGNLWSLNSISIPKGNANISNSFLMKYETLANFNYTRIILLTTSQVSTYSITVGNVKLEQGNYKTPFYPNPMYADILAIEQVYKTYNMAVRCLVGNVGDIFNTYCPISIPECFKNSTVKITVNTLDIYSLDGIKQTGFTNTNSYLQEYNCILFQSKKTKNLLKEIYIIIDFTIDLRPY